MFQSELEIISQHPNRLISTQHQWSPFTNVTFTPQLVYMHTHNSPPQVSDHDDDSAELPPARCDWSDQDKIKLIRFLIE